MRAHTNGGLDADCHANAAALARNDTGKADCHANAAALDRNDRKEIRMEIIKHGFGGSRKRQNFACHECGCVFIAEPTEYRTRRCYSTLELFDVHSCACPECG